MKVKSIVFGLLALKLIFLLYSPPPIPIPELISSYYSYALPRVLAAVPANFISFGVSEGYLFFLVPTLVRALWLMLFQPGVFAYYSLNSLIFVASVFLFYKLVQKYFKSLSPTVQILAAMLFVLSPWITQLFLAQFSFLLTLFFVLLALTYNRWLLFLACLSSLPGLVFSVIYATFSIQKTYIFKNYRKIFLIFAIIFLLLAFNRQYLVKTVKNSYPYSLRPSEATQEVNETQKIMFLATNKTYMIPSLIRKIAINKVEIVATKLIKHSVSFFDLEHLVLPQAALALVSLSGLGPKGYISLLTYTEVFLIFMGLYSLWRDKKKRMVIGQLFIAAYIPFLLYEKKFLAESAFLTIIPLLMIETIGLSYIHATKRKFLIAILVLLTIEQSTFLAFLTQKYQDYSTSHAFFAQKISELSQEKSTEPKVITTRFGPTTITTAYYLKLNPQTIWTEYAHNVPHRIENITFRPFDLPNEEPANTTFIGLPGEYVGPDKNPLEKPLPPDVKIEKQIQGFDDQVVFEYGNQLWLGKY